MSRWGLRAGEVSAIVKHIFRPDGPSPGVFDDEGDAFSLCIAGLLKLELRDGEGLLNGLAELQGAVQAVLDDAEGVEGPAAAYLLTIIDKRYLTWGDMSDLYDTRNDVRLASLSHRATRSVAYDLAIIFHREIKIGARDVSRSQEESPFGKAGSSS